MTGGERLELILFASSPDLVGLALGAGIDSFIVDWEWRGKEDRQAGRDTEINRDTADDLRRLARLGAPRRFCRVNRFGPWTAEEVATAEDCGATRLLLPMVESPGEVEALLELAGGRLEVGILVETAAGAARAVELAAQPLAAVYVGLNDLAISRGSAGLFDALVDGTVEAVRQAFDGVPFGVAGVTVVDGGRPIPCRLLLAEMARLGCAFSFLRRSFRRDIPGRDWGEEVARIQERWRLLRRRGAEEVERDRKAFADAVAAAGRPASP